MKTHVQSMCAGQTHTYTAFTSTWQFDLSSLKWLSCVSFWVPKCCFKKKKKKKRGSRCRVLCLSSSPFVNETRLCGAGCQLLSVFSMLSLNLPPPLCLFIQSSFQKHASPGKGGRVFPLWKIWFEPGEPKLQTSGRHPFRATQSKPTPDI